MMERFRNAADRNGERPLWLTIAIVIGLLPLLVVVFADLDLESQGWFAIGTLTLLFVLNFFPGRVVTLVLVTLSIVVSSRYIWWRLTNTLEFESLSEAFLGTGLLLAEFYAYTVLFIGFLQTVWPLDRRPEPLPDDPSLWPTVDVFIPTYNEPLSVVQITVLGALSLDYPPDRFRVYILDDGNREEFRQFAEEVGAGYITREDNAHAKAGNLNNALRHTDGELIAIFDADHVPTRPFLQLTVGWFLRDPKMSVVQTPHHFYSPDPFERNLATGYSIPNEGQLFYGLVQQGNDTWNAAFFCGSSAVIRRSALEDIGGFAVDTVTEDAHTALVLHRAGYTSAYIRVPMVAGLSTERLALHMGQRMRWARGMVQIFRVDNPLLGRGLTLAQRLCYLNAMMHFFFALPRFVFLTAPLAYLLFQQNIITTSALAILAYAGPHLVHAVVTNSRIQSRYRHSFWGEVYESVLTFYLLKPSLVTLINPRRGSFNVTEKGGLLPDSYFDHRIMRPQLILIAVLLFAVGIGILRLVFENLSETDTQVLALNMAWAIFNLLLLGAAVAAAREARQVRSNVRIRLKLPAVLYLPDGRTVLTETQDISMGGAYFRVDRAEDVGTDDEIDIELPVGSGSVIIPARVVTWEGEDLRVMFELATLEDQRNLVRVVFGRADAWLDWDQHAQDRPLRAAGSILRNIFGLFTRRRVRSVQRSRRQGVASDGTNPPNSSGPSFMRRRRRGAATATLLIGLAGWWAGGDTALAQQRSDTQPPPALGGPLPPSARPTGQGALQDRPMTPTTTAPRPVPRPAFDDGKTPEQRAREQAQSPVALDGSEGVPGQNGVPGQPAPVPPTDRLTPRGFALPPEERPGMLRPGEAATTATAAREELVGEGMPEIPGTRVDVITLKDLGVQSPMRLESVFDEESRPFSVRRDEVVTEARVNVNYAYSPALIPELSHLHVFINEELIGSMQLTKEESESSTITLAANPVLFKEDNTILFRFVGHYTLGCEDPMHSTLWATVSPTSSLVMRKERLPLRNDLSLLPLPFFDRKDANPLTLPFVLPNSPDTSILQAAGTVAGWFGSLASYRGASFPVSFGEVPTGNAVVLATSGMRPSGLSLPQIEGPTLAVVPNPYNTDARLLLVLGRDEEELRHAAQTVALGSSTLSGPTALVGPPQLPERVPYDAPNWVPTDRAIRLGELVSPADLQGSGLNPGILDVNFQAPPGIFAWRDAGIPLTVRYRYPSAQWVDWRNSRLDVLINDIYLKSLPLEQDTALTRMREAMSREFVENEGVVSIPPYLVFGRNQLQFYYNLKPYIPGYCEGQLPTDIRTGIDVDSTLDFSNTFRYAPLPNLAFFVNSGYPFTRMADLSETAVVLPNRMSEPVASAYLGVMGMIGDATGYPPVRATVVTADQVDSVADKDLLVLGPFSDQPLVGDWAPNSPFRVEGGQLRVRQASGIDRLYTLFDSEGAEDERNKADQLLMTTGDDLTGLVSFESPLAADRTVVMLLASEPRGVLRLSNAIRSRDLQPRVQGDLVVLKGNQLSSFRVGAEYAREDLPFWTRVRWFFADKPLLLLVLLGIGVLAIALALFFLLRKLASLRIGSRRERTS